MPTIAEFPSEKVKPLRLRMGLTQEEFALRVGVSRSLVGRWEAGNDREPAGSAAIVLRILDAQHPEEISS